MTIQNSIKDEVQDLFDKVVSTELRKTWIAKEIKQKQRRQRYQKAYKERKKNESEL